jgi:hypothetical protein
MCGVIIDKHQVVFLKKYRCVGFNMAQAAENTTLTITSLAGIKYLGRGKYVVFPKGHMYCDCCYSMQPLNMDNKAWVVSYKGQLVEPFLVCETCSKKMASFTSQPLYASCNASQLPNKQPVFLDKVCKLLCIKITPDIHEDIMWDA